MDVPLGLQNVGVLPVLQIMSPNALTESDRTSPLLLFDLLPQSVWWALKSPVTRTRDLDDLILSSSLAMKSMYSSWVELRDQ